MYIGGVMVTSSIAELFQTIPTKSASRDDYDKASLLSAVAAAAAVCRESSNRLVA